MTNQFQHFDKSNTVILISNISESNLYSECYYPSINLSRNSFCLATVRFCISNFCNVSKKLCGIL